MVSSKTLLNVLKKKGFEDVGGDLTAIQDIDKQKMKLQQLFSFVDDSKYVATSQSGRQPNSGAGALAASTPTPTGFVGHVSGNLPSPSVPFNVPPNRPSAGSPRGTASIMPLRMMSQQQPPPQLAGFPNHPHFYMLGQAAAPAPPFPPHMLRPTLGPAHFGPGGGGGGGGPNLSSPTAATMNPHAVAGVYSAGHLGPKRWPPPG